MRFFFPELSCFGWAYSDRNRKNPLKVKKNPAFGGVSYNDWCGRGDSNPHALRRHPLKMVRLPVPPLPQRRGEKNRTRSVNPSRPCRPALDTLTLTASLVLAPTELASTFPEQLEQASTSSESLAPQVPESPEQQAYSSLKIVATPNFQRPLRSSFGAWSWPWTSA